MSRIKIEFYFKKLLPALAIILAAIFAGRYILLHPTTPSFWTNMGVGRFILEQKSVPNHNNISFKSAGANSEWITENWLSDLILYVAGSNSVTFGAIFLLLTTVSLTFYLLMHIFRLLKVEQVTQYVILAIGLIMVAGFWKLHPLAISLPLMTGLIYIYFKWRIEGTKQIYSMPIVVILYANLAGGYLLIPTVFIGIAIVAEITLWVIDGLSGKKSIKPKGNFLDLVIASAIAFIVTGANPLGFKIWAYVPTALNILTGPTKDFSNLAGVLTASNMNVVKNSPSSIFYETTLIYILTVVLLFIFWTVRKPREFLTLTFPGILLIPFLALPFLWVYFIPLTILASLPLAGQIIDYTGKQLAINNSFKELLIHSFILFISIGFLYLIITPPKTYDLNLPKEQIKIMKDNALPANTLTSIDLDGYVFYSLYPLRAGLGAQDDFFDEFELINVYSEPQAIDPKIFKDITTSFNINTILTSKDQDYLAITASLDPDWALIYFDYNGILFVRRSAVSKDFLDKNELKEINFARNLGFTPHREKETITELEKFVNKYPNDQFAIGQLASVYLIQKNYGKAISTLNRVPQNKWNFDFKTEMGRIMASQGLCKSAEDWFLESLKERSEKNVSRTVFEMSILYAGCFKDMAKANHYLQRYVSFPIPGYEREKAIQIGKTFGIKIDEQ